MIFGGEKVVVVLRYKDGRGGNDMPEEELLFHAHRRDEDSALTS